MHIRQLLPLIIVIALILNSCREDIIVPGNFAGNINEPIQENKLNYFSFTIKAQDLTSNFSTKTDFLYSTNKISITISDIETGTITVGVNDGIGVSLYNSTNISDVEGEYKRISGSIPDRIYIYLANFTGKLKVSLSYISE